MKEKLLKTHCFRLHQPSETDSEGLFITTKFFDNGDKKNNIFTNQEITLNSYGNSASFNLCGISITPKKLRELADELDRVYQELEK